VNCSSDSGAAASNSPGEQRGFDSAAATLCCDLMAELVGNASEQRARVAEMVLDVVIGI
jgi:hypothetical protein